MIFLQCEMQTTKGPSRFLQKKIMFILQEAFLQINYMCNNEKEKNSYSIFLTRWAQSPQGQLGTQNLTPDCLAQWGFYTSVEQHSFQLPLRTYRGARTCVLQPLSQGFSSTNKRHYWECQAQPPTVVWEASSEWPAQLQPEDGWHDGISYPCLVHKFISKPPLHGRNTSLITNTVKHIMCVPQVRFIQLQFLY